MLVEQRQLPPSVDMDRDHLLPLVSEVVSEGHSVLIFCAGRAACQSCAKMLAQHLPALLGPPTPDQGLARQALVDDIKEALSGYCSPDMAYLIGMVMLLPLCCYPLCCYHCAVASLTAVTVVVRGMLS